MKKIIGIFMVLSMLMCSLPTVQAENGDITVLGTDVDTKGNWVDIYGKSGYNIFYGDTDETSGRDNTAQHISNIPEYAQIKVTTGGFSYQVKANPSTDDRALLMPETDGYVRRAITTYNYNRNAFNVKIADGNAHIVSFYITSFDSNYNKIYYKITDANGNIIEISDLDYSKGTYISICADTEFNFEIGEYDTGAQLGVNAIFFDELVDNSVSKFSASRGNEARTINLEWNGEKAVNIYRKAENETLYELIAENFNAKLYTDADLVPGRKYYYQIRELNGRLYSKELTAECATKDYEKIYLSVEGDKSINFDKLGDLVTVAVKATDEDGNPIDNIEICAIIDGDFPYLSEEEKNVKQAVTNNIGIAEIDLIAEYYGDYKIKFISNYDDEREYYSTETYIDINLEAGVHRTVPYISKVSEEIEPGEIFNLYGQGITGDNIEIMAYPANGKPSNEPPSDAYKLEVLQKDISGYGYYVSTMLREDILPGIYDIWVKNDYGWSNPIRLNGPVGLFIDEYEICPGVDVRLVGRNLDGSRYGTQTVYDVRLVNDNGDIYGVNVKEANRVMISFNIDEDIPIGVYNVEVNNSKINNWSRIESGQTLTVIKKTEDPLGLAVPWVGKFNWTSYYAEDFDIVPDISEDQSEKITAAIKKIHSNGGGVLNFNEGEYTIGFVSLYSDVILNGAGKDKTIFNKIEINDNRFVFRFESSAKKKGCVGIANLTVYAETETSIPTETYFKFDGNDTDCSNIFMHNVDILIGESCEKRKDAVTITGVNERLLIQNCSFDGIPAAGYVRKYGKYLNNEFRYCENTIALFAEYSSIINNKGINPQVASGKINTSQSIHGFSIKGNTYFAENEIILGLHPDKEGRGEVVMLEPPNGFFACGKVINARDNLLRVQNIDHMVSNGEIVLPKPIYNDLSVTIAGGQGMGQNRKVIGSVGDDTLIVDRPWDINPDASSTFTMLVAFENTTIYKNIGKECEQNIAFYSNCFDCVAIENELDTTSGIRANAFHIEGSNRICPVYNIRIEDNVITNFITPDVYVGLSSTGQRGGDDVQFIGMEFRNNYISNSKNHPLYQGEIGTRIRLSENSVGYNYNALGTILDSNTYVGFEKPILLENVSGVILNDNKFVDSGATFITETSSSNILYMGEKAGTVYFTDDQALTGNVYHSTNIINETGKDVSGKLILALYGSDNRLKQIVFKDVSILKNSRLSDDIVLSGDDTLAISEGDTLKTFLWSDLNNLLPLAEKGTLTIK